MAKKTITIDLEAYGRLKSAKKPEESISQTIKRLIPSHKNLKAWLKGVERNPLGRRAARAIEIQVNARTR